MNFCFFRCSKCIGIRQNKKAKRRKKIFFQFNDFMDRHLLVRNMPMCCSGKILKLMKKQIFYLLLLIIYFQTNAQENVKSHELSGGIGKTLYTDNYYFPGGIYGPDYSLLYNFTKDRVNKSVDKSFFNLYFSYAQLGRKDIETEMNIPTHYWDITIKKEWLYNIPLKINKLLISCGFNTMFNGIYYKYTLDKINYQTVQRYGKATLSLGISQYNEYSIGKFIIKDHWTLPVVLYGFFMEYQNYYYFDIDYLYKHTQFVFINNYFQFNNYFSIEYPLFKNSNLKFSYFFESDQSQINNISVKDIKHQFLIGVVFKRS